MRYYKILYYYYTLHYTMFLQVYSLKRLESSIFFLGFETIQSLLLIFYFGAQVCNILFGYLILRMSGNVRHHLLAFNVLCACPSP